MCRWRAGRMSSVICRTGSPPMRSRLPRRWPGIADDALQDMLIRKAFRRAIARPVHYVPTAEGFAAAVQAGLGWGMFPEQLAAADAGRRIVCPDLRRAPRCAVVLAVLEAGQPDGHDDHRCGSIGSGRPRSRIEVVSRPRRGSRSDRRSAAWPLQNVAAIAESAGTTRSPKATGRCHAVAGPGRSARRPSTA